MTAAKDKRPQRTRRSSPEAAGMPQSTDERRRAVGVELEARLVQRADPEAIVEHVASWLRSGRIERADLPWLQSVAGRAGGSALGSMPQSSGPGGPPTLAGIYFAPTPARYSGLPDVPLSGLTAPTVAMPFTPSWGSGSGPAPGCFAASSLRFTILRDAEDTSRPQLRGEDVLSRLGARPHPRSGGSPRPRRPSPNSSSDPTGWPGGGGSERAGTHGRTSAPRRCGPARNRRFKSDDAPLAASAGGASAGG